ncbi:MAG: N-acetylmuramoyl-L-alanine amidase [Gemmatimonadales bacterium]
MKFLAVTAFALLAAAPTRLQVSTARGVVVIPLRSEAGQGAMVPLGPLAQAIGAKWQREAEWFVLVSAAGTFKFLPGTSLVDDGSTVRGLPADSHRRGDSLFVPLAFVAEMLADPLRRTWNWTPGTAVLAEGPAPSQLLTRPSRTTVGREERSRLPNGLKPGHHVTIDAGHGGTDPGNPGLYFPGGLKEKHITLTVAMLLRDELERRGIKVTMTRTTDTLISLGHRAPRFCRTEDCDLFVSLHVNSLNARPGYTRVRGFETYFLAEARTADAERVAKMENDAARFDPDAADEAASGGLDFILKDLARNEFLRESARAAELVQSSLREVADAGTLDRGVKQAGFAVLSTARRPAILIEMGYSTNPDDARQMTTRNGQDGIASAIAEAIVKYLQQYDRKTTDARRAGEP